MKNYGICFLMLSLLSSCGQIDHFSVAGRLQKTDTPPLQGITFADASDEIYLPLSELQRVFRDLELPWEEKKELRTLVNGQPLVSLSALEKRGVQLTRAEERKRFRLKKQSREVDLEVGAKSVLVDLSGQRLRAWQGTRLVLSCRVSSGKGGSTPRGRFYAGPYKARHHYSSRYDNAHMPWSVQVAGHVFIHGYSSVPAYPASHGCIRLPLDEGNPARFFYQWITRGTPVEVR